jgi:hypothetical protein
MKATRESQAYRKARQSDMGVFARRRAIRMARRRGQLSAEQAADARGVLSEIKTPMSAGQAAVGAGATVNVINNVTRTIPAGSVLYVEGLAPGDTINTVSIDGVNIFSNGAVGQGLLNPATFNASGLLIPSAITQNITTSVTNNGGAATNAVCTLLAPSIEVESILDAASDACV